MQELPASGCEPAAPPSPPIEPPAPTPVPTKPAEPELVVLASPPVPPPALPCDPVLPPHANKRRYEPIPRMRAIFMGRSVAQGDSAFQTSDSAFQRPFLVGEGSI